MPCQDSRNRAEGEKNGLNQFWGRCPFPALPSESPPHAGWGAGRVPTLLSLPLFASSLIRTDPVLENMDSPRFVMVQLAIFQLHEGVTATHVQ